jgi:hypothetical protein
VFLVARGEEGAALAAPSSPRATKNTKRNHRPRKTPVTKNEYGENIKAAGQNG